jgi:hypothetical protein
MSEVDFTADNSYILMYANDMMDGILWEDEENYAFVSAHTEGYDQLADELETLGCEIFDMTDSEVDFEEQPHSFVLRAVAKLVVNEAETQLK